MHQPAPPALCCSATLDGFTVALPSLRLQLLSTALGTVFTATIVPLIFVLSAAAASSGVGMLGMLWASFVKLQRERIDDLVIEGVVVLALLAGLCAGVVGAKIAARGCCTAQRRITAWCDARRTVLQLQGQQLIIRRWSGPRVMPLADVRRIRVGSLRLQLWLHGGRSLSLPIVGTYPMRSWLQRSLGSACAQERRGSPADIPAVIQNVHRAASTHPRRKD